LPRSAPRASIRIDGWRAGFVAASVAGIGRRVHLLDLKRPYPSGSHHMAGEFSAAIDFQIDRPANRMIEGEQLAFFRSCGFSNTAPISVGDSWRPTFWPPDRRSAI
ncbi:MAG TPA: hypothetical protein VGE83_09710, partial [Terracidiphilus sp.]